MPPIKKVQSLFDQCIKAIEVLVENHIFQVSDYVVKNLFFAESEDLIKALDETQVSKD